MTTTRWSKEQIKLAFYLYCQIPFGKIDSKNKEIIALAKIIGRSPSAVAMKMLNIASLDPAITSTGRVALGNASGLDRDVWDEFHANWEALANEVNHLRNQFDTESSQSQESEIAILDEFTGTSKKVFINQRINQNFFRRAVLSSYRGRCCITGISESKLLIASHIVPWSVDTLNRLNPSNGLCLSALHDKAFDKGLISISESYEILISPTLKRSRDKFVQDVLLNLEGKSIDLPERFIPHPEFLMRHRDEVFLSD